MWRSAKVSHKTRMIHKATWTQLFNMHQKACHSHRVSRSVLNIRINTPQHTVAATNLADIPTTLALEARPNATQENALNCRAVGQRRDQVRDCAQLLDPGSRSQPVAKTDLTH